MFCKKKIEYKIYNKKFEYGSKNIMVSFLEKKN